MSGLPRCLPPSGSEKEVVTLVVVVVVVGEKGVATFGQKPDVGEVSGIFVLACLKPNQTGTRCEPTIGKINVDVY